MYDVFISYSTEDKSTVEAICNYLTNHDVHCFFAQRDITGGYDWAKFIPPALHNSRMMLTVFSKSFNESLQTDRELHIAADIKIPILTFRISNEKFTGVKEYFLLGANYIDASIEPQKHFDRLLHDTALLLNKKNVVTQRTITTSPSKVPRTAAEEVCFEAKCLLYNDEENRDPMKAFYLFNKAAREGLAEAQYELSQCYWSGWGCPQNWAKVRKWLSKAAAQGYPKAQRELGRMYHYAIGGEQDAVKAMRLYTSAAEAGDGWAAKRLGLACITGELGNVKDEERSREWYDLAYELLQKQSFESNDYDAMRILGFSYLDGEGVDSAPHLGFKWLQRAATLHNAAAYNGIYQCYSKGHGIHLDKERALEMVKTAANLECRTAQNYLAQYYHEQGNDALEMDYRMRAAEGGYVGAQVDLAKCYESGCAPYKQNLKEAERWYSRAIESGSLEALYHRGLMLEKEEKANNHNNKEAMKYFKRAAVLGYAFAWVALANYYFDKKDYVVAKLWCKRYLKIYDQSVKEGRDWNYIPNGQGGKIFISFNKDKERTMLVQVCEKLAWIYRNIKAEKDDDVENNLLEANRLEAIAEQMKFNSDVEVSPMRQERCV